MAKRKQNNLVIWVLLGILFLCFALLGFGFWKYFYAGAGTTKYGDRLEDISSHPLSETLKEDIVKIYEGNENIGDITVTVEGKIVYITIDYKTALSKADAQNLAIKSLEPIGEGNLAYYDVQYILTYSAEVSEENINFPMFGSKSASSNKVVW